MRLPRIGSLDDLMNPPLTVAIVWHSRLLNECVRGHVGTHGADLLDGLHVALFGTMLFVCSPSSCSSTSAGAPTSQRSIVTLRACTSRTRYEKVGFGTPNTHPMPESRKYRRKGDLRGNPRRFGSPFTALTRTVGWRAVVDCPHLLPTPRGRGELFFEKLKKPSV